jgi:L-seryl-tRNA(Ser) seleniumtransferase
MTTETRSLYSQLPAIDRLLRDSSFLSLRDTYGHTRVVELLRQMLDEAREVIRGSQTLPAWCENWAQEVDARLTKEAQSALRPVINLTGTVLHTNLGRALQAEAAVEAVAQAMRSPVTLEYDLDDAGRGHRDRALAQLLCRITGAEDACIVNNNAAAVLLMLAATASGKEVVVSRGELVEIGGAFRIPDVMRQAGCTLHEVGTTNRTHANDYRQAVNENTALLMKVHTSNYSIQGFTKAIDEAELVALGKELDVPVVTDLGSGSLVDLSQYGLPKEPMPQELIAAGVSLVSFSGDKLLGGPQAGIIVGKKEMIARLQSHPLKRALRADKMTLAALEATLRLYLHPEALSEKLPTLRLLTRSAEVIQIQAQRLQAPLAAHYGAEFAVQVMPCLSQIGSGSLPVDRLPSAALTFTPHDGRGSHLESLAARWRELPVPEADEVLPAPLPPYRVLTGLVDRFGRTQTFHREAAGEFSGEITGVTDGAWRHFRLVLTTQAQRAEEARQQAISGGTEPSAFPDTLPGYTEYGRDNGIRLSAVWLTHDPEYPENLPAAPLVRYGWTPRGELAVVYDRSGKQVFDQFD